jgi:hypothetical protein
MTTCRVVPVTTWLRVGETIVTTAGDEGRDPAGVGRALAGGALAAEAAGGAVAPGLLQAARATSTATSRNTAVGRR